MVMVDNEDLGLSLSLGFAKSTVNSNINKSNSNLELNLRPDLLVSSSVPQQKPSWITDQGYQYSDLNSDSSRTETGRSFLRGIDVNRLPSNTDCEEEAGVSSPNSTLSSVSGKRSARSLDQPSGNVNNNNNSNNNGSSEELIHEIERTSSRGISDEEDGDTSRKKLRLSKDQSAVLEESFKEHNTLNPKQKMALAKQLGLRPRQVEVWFQNRRARTKLKQTEVDCEFLKRCCENLTEENRRLQKEVQELRALKLSPQFYMQMAPPTTLTMCPSCERVAVPPPQPPSAVDPRQHQHMGPTHFRPMPINPWATAAAHHGHFDAQRLR